MTYRETWDLSSIPEEVLKSEWARRNSMRRETHTGGHNGGRPVEYVPCPRCGKQVTKTEARRGHGCT